MRKLLWGLIAAVLANGVALYAADHLLEGMQFSPAGDELWKPLLLGAVLLGVLNAIVRPLLSLLALPLILLSFGLVYVLINAGMLWLLSIALTFFEPSFSLVFATWFTMVLAAVVVGIVNNVVHWILPD